MKHYILLSTIMAMLVAMNSCTDEIILPEGMVPISIEYKGEPVDAFLNITVGELSVGVETRADDDDYDPYEDTEAERWVNDLWVFQYDATQNNYGKAIADPIFIDKEKIPTQETLKNLPITLSDNDGDPSIVYVVANAGSDEAWGNNFESIDLLMSASLNTREPIFVTTETANGDLSIPMEGNSDEVTVKKSDVVTVPVTRMYAKIMIDPYVELTNSEIYSVGVGNIPLYCQVGTLWSGDATKAATYPESVQWISRSFTTLLDDDTEPVKPDSDTNEFPDFGYRYIVYVPENIQGKAGDTNTTKLKQEDKAPSQALQVNIVISHTDYNGGVTNYPYTVYPGANTTTDYNIKRNNVYRVKVNIEKLSIARVPSANCFFAYEGTTISFFPYYRVETGGGYDFTDYLNPDGAEDAQTNAGAKIDHVGIVWQTKDCIGDNTKGALVYLSTNSSTHTGYEQIYVKANKEGNALIAAYDTKENIIWSWHIWVRNPAYSDPTNISNAKLYYTYQWDNTQIYGYEYEGNGDPTTATPTGRTRVAGYEVMSCNLGALQDEPNYNFNNGYWGTSGNSNIQYFQDGDGIVRTFGMMYQWGRKDPFPPLTTTLGSFVGAGSGDAQGKTEGINTGYYIHDYSDEHTQQLYGNDNSTAVHKTSYGDESYLFHSHIHNTETDVITGMRYSIAHPTVFLCGTDKIAQSLQDAYTHVNADWTEYVADLNNYIYKGGWSDEDEYDAQEWGSSDPSSSTKVLDLGIKDDAGYEIYLYDDYGTEKSIFDPCPYGWRVSSGDLWLGFSVNGINLYDTKIWDGDTQLWNRMSNANYEPTKSCLLGLTMYLGDATNRFRVGDTSWFPTQGFLLPDGCGYRVGGCGNYVNANADSDPSATDGYARVYITHIHAHSSSFKVFETQMQYTVKSTGGPLRCIRDTY